MITLSVFERGIPRRQWTFSEMMELKDPGRIISFDPSLSMFDNEKCFWHEFHYFVSQIYYGERLGIKVAQKLKEGTTSIETKRIFDYMGADEQLHGDIFEDYIIETFGSIFPMSSGLEKVIRMCTELEDARIVALVTHGVLEPVSMVILKTLRSFVQDSYFHQFTERVLRDEALHIRLVPDKSEVVNANQNRRREFQNAATSAFKAMASAGKCKMLLQKLEEEGIDIRDEKPFQSQIYRRKFALTTRLVANQVGKAGLELFPKER